MENNLSSLSLQDLVAMEKMVSIVCKKYENIAQMNKSARDMVLDEMETRIGKFV